MHFHFQDYPRDDAFKLISPFYKNAGRLPGQEIPIFFFSNNEIDTEIICMGETMQNKQDGLKKSTNGGGLRGLKTPPKMSKFDNDFYSHNIYSKFLNLKPSPK